MGYRADTENIGAMSIHFSTHVKGSAAPLRRADSIKLIVIGILAIVALFVTTYAVQHQQEVVIARIYYLIPHLYLVPLILVGLWYPKRGLQVTVLLVIALVILSVYLYAAGFSIDPFLSLMNAGMDIGIFVMLALYVKDRNLVDSVIREFMEHQSKTSAGTKSVQDARERAKMKFQGDIEDMIRGLRAKDDDTREEAARALGEIQNPRVIDPLISALRDDNRYVRNEAARSLGRIKDRYCREGAAEGLGDMGEKAVSPLIGGLTDQDWHVRMGAVIALRIIGDPDAVPYIEELLSDENRFVRREAVKSLGRIGNEHTTDALVKALSDEDAGVRMRAIGALARCGRESAIEPIIAALNDEDSSVRLRATRALEEMEDPRAVEALNNPENGKLHAEAE
jgi:hypothetical protein